METLGVFASRDPRGCAERKALLESFDTAEAYLGKPVRDAARSIENNEGNLINFTTSAIALAVFCLLLQKR